MRKADNAEAMRLRAHQIWEREGRPHGREHEHWAEAARQLATEEEAETPINPEDTDALPEDTEADRLRRALYSPEAFSVELLDLPADVVQRDLSGRSSRSGR